MTVRCCKMETCVRTGARGLTLNLTFSIDDLKHLNNFLLAKS